MGCGKSTIGRKLASLMGWDLIDTDSLIERREGVSIAEIFDTHGEEYFRAMESEVLREVIARGRNCIISTGGGLPLWGDNMEVMNGTGESVYICRTAENIASRLSLHGRAKRPKIRGLSDEELVAYMSENIALRDEVYRRSSLIIDAVPLSDRAILDIIIDRIRERGSNESV